MWQVYENVTTNTDGTTAHLKDAPVDTDAIRITITATTLVDADKEMRQLIITQKLYQFEGFPQIKKPVHSKNIKTNRMGSGRR